jgi:hypothetical protein
VKLTDSNVRSLVIKASHASQGKRPQPAPQDFANPKDKFLGKLFEELMAVKDSLAVEEKLPDGTTEHQELSAAEWVASLGAIKESCSLPTGSEPGSRDYLDFLAGFIAQARGRK